MNLPGGESTLLKQGDVVVQRGTAHSWITSSDEWTRMYWIILGKFITSWRSFDTQRTDHRVVGAKPVEVNGEVLGEAWSLAPK